MYYYQVLSTLKLPEYFLTYCLEKPLNKGQTVLIEVRNKQVFGIIWAQVPKPDFETKEILEIVNYNFDLGQLEFMRIFAFNTFNHLNNVFEAQIHFMDNLTKANLEALKNLEKTPQKIELGFEINFVLDTQLTLRIRTIIRTIKSGFDDIVNNQLSLQTRQKVVNNLKILPFKEVSSMDDGLLRINESFNKNNPQARLDPLVRGMKSYKVQILVLFPEKKYLDKILGEFKKFDPLIRGNIDIYTGSPTKQSKSCVRDLVLEQDNFQIIFGTRASLFLPFSNLIQIILVDEANSMYIQDQGGLYYDTREAVFLLAKANNCRLDFVSTLPSLRLFSFYQQNWAQMTQSYPQKPVNTTINVNL